MEAHQPPPPPSYLARLFITRTCAHPTNRTIQLTIYPATPIKMTVEFFLFPSLEKATISRLEQLLGYRSSQAVSPRMRKAAIVTVPSGSDDARRQERELYVRSPSRIRNDVISQV